MFYSLGLQTAAVGCMLAMGSVESCPLSEVVGVISKIKLNCKAAKGKGP